MFLSHRRLGWFMYVFRVMQGEGVKFTEQRYQEHQGLFKTEALGPKPHIRSHKPLTLSEFSLIYCPDFVHSLRNAVPAPPPASPPEARHVQAGASHLAGQTKQEGYRSVRPVPQVESVKNKMN